MSRYKGGGADLHGRKKKRVVRCKKSGRRGEEGGRYRSGGRHSLKRGVF